MANLEASHESIDHSLRQNNEESPLWPVLACRCVDKREEETDTGAHATVNEAHFTAIREENPSRFRYEGVERLQCRRGADRGSVPEK